MTHCYSAMSHVPASVLADALSAAGCWSTGEGTVAAWLVCRSWHDVLRSPSRLAAALVASRGPGDALIRIVHGESVDKLALVQEVLACSEPTLPDLAYALAEAASRGATPVVQALLQYPCTPCLSVSCQHAALFFASRDGHDDTVKLLLEWPHGERFQQTTINEAFIKAASAGRLSTMALLRQHAEPFTEDLHLTFVNAVSRGRFWIVRYLLSSPTNPVRADSRNSEGLTEAASQGHVGLARLLLSWPQHPARADDDGCKALVAAAEAGHWKIVRLLLGWPQHAPPVGGEGSYEALVQAMDKGHVKVVKVLLKHFISGSPADCQLGKVLAGACRLGDTRLVRLLLTRPPNAPSADGEPSGGRGGPLVAAATAGHVHVARLLLKAGARSKILEAFRAAAAGGHAEVAELLLGKAKEANDGAAIAHDVGALAAAIKGGHREVVSWLLALRKGCPETSFADVFDDRWLVMAVESGSTETVRLLLEALPQAADVMSRVGKGALIAAVDCSTAETVQLLLERMARLATAAGGAGEGSGNCCGGSCSSSSGGDGVMWWDGRVLEVAARRGDREVVQALLDAWPRPPVIGASGFQDTLTPTGGVEEGRGWESPSGEDLSRTTSSGRSIPPSAPSSSPSSPPRSSLTPPASSPPSPSYSAECADDDRRRRVQAALVAAAGAHHDDVVRQLLQWDHPDAPRADGWDSEALRAAVRNRCTSTTRLLLDWPVHPALADCQEGRALADAIANYDDEAVAMLLQRPERPARGDLRDGALLVLACRCGSGEAVRMLLESPHPPRADCQKGRALVEATQRRDSYKVQQLLGWHCHAPRADMNEGEVLIAAAKAGYTSLMETLLSWPSNPPRADCRNGEVLMAAVRVGSLEGVRLLLGWPVHPAHANTRDGAALLAAARSWHGAEMLDLLLSWPTHTPRADCQHGAALRYAVMRGDEASVRALLQAGVSEEVLRKLVGQCGGLMLCELLRQELQALTLR